METAVVSNKTLKMLREEVRLGQPLEKAIAESYEKHNGDLKEVGQELGIKEATLYNWMLRLGLTRKVSLVQR